MNKFLEKKTAKMKPQKAYDFGCGDKTNLRALNRLGWNVIGFDIKERTDLSEPVILQKVPFIYSMWVLPFIPDKKKKRFVRNMRNALTSNGKILVACFHISDEEIGECGEDRTTLKRIFEEDFDNIKIDREIYEDEPHEGFEEPHTHNVLILTAKRRK